MEPTSTSGFNQTGGWVMLVFAEKTPKMAAFVKALVERYGRERQDLFRVGINAVNVTNATFEEIKADLSAEKFGYKIRIP